MFLVPILGWTSGFVLTQVASANGTGGTITCPTVQDNDLIVIADSAGGSSTPANTTPTDFFQIKTVTASGSSLVIRSTLSYRLATASMSGTVLTTINGDTWNACNLIVFRGNPPIHNVTVGSLNFQATTGTPTNQIVTASTGTPTLIVLAEYAGSATITTHGFTPAADGTLLSPPGYTSGPLLSYRIYNTAPADTTMDMADVGALNTLMSCYLECSPSASTLTRVDLIGLPDTLVGGTDYFICPTYVQAGDLIILDDFNLDGTNPDVVPTGFTRIGTSYNVDNYRNTISYKVCNGTEGGFPMHGLPDATFTTKTTMVFRGNKTIASVTVGDVAQEITTGNPVAQVVNVSGQPTPVIVLAEMIFQGAGTPSRTMTPSSDGEIANDSNRQFDVYKIFNAGDTPVDTTCDTGDAGTQYNILRSCYITCTGGTAPSIAAATATYVSNYWEATGSDPWTTPSMSLGTAAATRKIVAFIQAGNNDGSMPNINGVTIAGIAAIKALDGGTAPTGDIWVADVPSGTSGTVVVDFSSTPITQFGIFLYALYNAQSSVPMDTVSSTATSQNLSLSIDVPPGGVIIGARSGAAISTGGTYTWTNLDEDADIPNATTPNIHQRSCASREFTTAQFAYSVAANCSDTTPGTSICLLASWR